MIPALIRRDPWELFLEPIDRELLSPLFLDDEERLFIPLIDVFHDEEKVTIRVEVPGCKREDLNVRVENDLLIISGKKEHVPSGNYHQVETRCGSFERSITLGHSVNVDKMTAVYQDGVLTVTMPLLAQAQPKKIPIEKT